MSFMLRRGFGVVFDVLVLLIFDHRPVIFDCRFIQLNRTGCGLMRNGSGLVALRLSNCRLFCLLNRRGFLNRSGVAAPSCEASALGAGLLLFHYGNDFHLLCLNCARFRMFGFGYVQALIEVR